MQLVVAGEQPVEQRRAGAADMEEAGRRGGKADDDAHGPVCKRCAAVTPSKLTPSPPSGAERVGVRWGIPERLPMPTSPSHPFGAGPSLAPLKGAEGQSKFFPLGLP